MNKFYFRLLVFIFCLGITAGLRAQVTVTGNANTTPALAATYTSLANAVTALQGITAISGPVTITLAAGNPQTAPVGGYEIRFAATTTGARSVTFNGNNNTITANAALVSGSLTDGIFKIIGADFITIQNFTLRENPSNSNSAAATNNMTEWGVALLYSSATNGAQNNLIRLNTISLNRAYSNSFGIYSNTRHTSTVVTVTADITAATGANSSNFIASNNINNVNAGIAMIGSGNAAFMDISNSIAQNVISNSGGQSAASNFISNSGSSYGIFINNQKSESVNNNTIASAGTGATSVAMRGIFKTYSTVPTGTFSTNISSNNITIDHAFSSGVLEGIRSEGISAPLSTASISILSNVFQNISVSAASSSATITGITNTSQCGVLNINNNIFRGASSTATTGGFTAISNTGAVQTTVNINLNQVGDASGNAVTFSAATSGALTGISCATIAAGAVLSISNNNFQGFVQTVAGTGNHNYITYSHAANSATTDNVNANFFVNIIANTSGSINFISRTGTMATAAGATENCNGNAIIGTFSKPVAGGTVTLCNAGSGSLSGNSMVQTGNNFSNISVTGATVMNGWINTEGGVSGPTKTISNNTFSNWACGSGTVVVMRTDFSDNNTSVSNNTISNISASAAITGISLGNSNKGALQSCSGNTITGLTSTGAATVLGIFGGSASITTLNVSNNIISDIATNVAGSFAAIRMFTAATTNVFKNKIYNISGTGTATLVNGIDVQSAAVGTYNIHNNIVGDLIASASSSVTAIRGISLLSVNAGTTYDVFYNTVYINATSSGANFGTAAFYAGASATAANAVLSLRNNIFVNTSASNGTGVTASYRRSLNALNNLDNSSNNNIFYAGTPSATNLIFYDGTNSDQTLADYKTRVTPRDAASFTELPPFLSTLGGSANFLHLNPGLGTQAESGAVNIAAYTDDFDGNIRQGNPGYTGVGTAPDIGADEIANETNPPVITYTTITSPICIFSGMTVSGVVIKDSSGVPLTGALVPRIYFRKNAGAWFSAAGVNTGGVAKNSTWKFTITEASMGGVVVGDVISYYIIAQDIMPTPNIGANPGAGLAASNVNTVTTAPAFPNSYTVSGSLNGLYTVGVGGNFTTFAAAVAAYNSACSLAGPVIFELTDTLYTTPSETFQISINNHIDASAVKTLTIRPSATAAPSITAASANSIIRLNGARYVIFDGRQSGTGSVKSLTISNTGTGATFSFVNAAQNSTVKFCVIKGQSTNSSSGTVLFGSSNNVNDTIDNNDITDANAQPLYGIHSTGSANNNISITNNNISNYYHLTDYSAGIFISSTSGWTITGNRLFQTDTRLYNGDGSFGIYIFGGQAHTISNNIIGFANAAGTGTTNMIANSVLLPGFPAAYSFTGTKVNHQYFPIYAYFTSGGVASAIDGNIISGIAYLSGDRTNFFTGIYVANGTANIGSVAGNIIGSESGNNSLYLVSSGVSKFSDGGRSRGIFANSNSSVAIQNNKIGGILISSTADTLNANFDAVLIGGTASYTVSNNFIGNADANNLRLGYASSGGLLSNTGTLSFTSGSGAYGLPAFNGLGGIICYVTGNSLAITGNTFRGWSLSSYINHVVGVYTEGNMTGLTPSINISNNNFGTASRGWFDFAVPGNLPRVVGIQQINDVVTSVTISGNDFRGGSYINSTVQNSSILMIEQRGNAVANSNININNNSITDLLLQTQDLIFIQSYADLTATSKRVIDNNRVVGNLSTTGGVKFIESAGISIAGSQVSITNNNFSNVIAGSSVFGIQEYSGGIVANGFAQKKINNNTLSNWVVNNTFSSATGIEVANMGSLLSQSDSICNNVLSNITASNGLNGISSGYSNLIYGNAASVIEISNNQLSGFISNGSFFGDAVSGIYVDNSNMNSKTFVRNNSISALNNSGTDNINFGILLGPAGNNIEVSGNRIYDISGNGTGFLGTIVSGISTGFDLSFGGGAAKNVNIYNNLVSDLRATITGSAIFPAVAGINLVGGGDSLHVFNNTVTINSVNSNGNSFFSTAALFSNTTAKSFVRNNIVNNTSTPGSAGFTVSHWRLDADLANYSGLCNNNLLYAGTPSARRLIYFDGSNADQTLAAYKTRLGGIKESASVTEQPVFLSTVGADANFLHLDPNANCASLAKGDNSVHLSSTDFDNDTRMTVAPFIIDIGADETTKLTTWTGSSNTFWNNSSNWSTGIVPNGSDKTVLIPAAPVNQPRIGVGETFQAKNLVLAAGASLTNWGTVKIAGSLNASAASVNNINAGVVTGSIEMNRPCANVQVLAGNVFTGNAVKNFKMSNDLTLSATAGQGLHISGELGFDAVSSKTFTTNNNVVLVSTADATANVGIIGNGNTITGQLTVERFIPARRSWRLLTAPLSSTATTTISQAWQDGQQATTIPPPAYTAGSGSLITFSTTAVNGYDKGSTNNPSLKFYNGTAWVAPANTTMPINTHSGYMLFVRGDRNISIGGTSVVANTTTLRPKGAIHSGPQNIAATVAGFKVIGNPYASAINFHTTIKTGLADQYRLWDPKIGGIAGVGGFVTFAWNSLNNNYDRTVTGFGSSVLPQDGTIQSGAAFVVNFSGAGNLQIRESDKLSTSASAPFGRPASPVAAEGRLSANLGFYDSDGSLQLLDGVLVTFHSSYNNALDKEDAIKITNVNEDFGINKNDTAIAIERRSPIRQNDTVFFKFTQPKLRTYILQLAPMHLAAPGLTAFLDDTYTNTQTPVSLTDTTHYSFATNNADAGSYAPGRLRLIFKTTSIDSLAPVFLQLSATEKNSKVLVEWKVNSEQFVVTYEIEKSVNGVDFIKVASIIADGNRQYQWLDVQPVQGVNFYRIKKIGTNGEYEYSSIVSARVGKGNNWVSIYPNPVTNGIINLQIRNSITGSYTLRLVNAIGQSVLQTSVNHPGGESVRKLELKGVSNGYYQMEISNSSGQQFIYPLLVQRK